MGDSLEAMDDTQESRLKILSCIGLDECGMPWCFRDDDQLGDPSLLGQARGPDIKMRVVLGRHMVTVGVIAYAHPRAVDELCFWKGFCASVPWAQEVDPPSIEPQDSPEMLVLSSSAITDPCVPVIVYNFAAIPTDNEDDFPLTTGIDPDRAMKMTFVGTGHLSSDEESDDFSDSEDEDTITKCSSFDTPACSMSRPMPQLPPRPGEHSGPRDVSPSGEEASSATSLMTTDDCMATFRDDAQRSLSYALDETESKQRALQNMPAMTPRPLSNKLKTRGRPSSRLRRPLLRGGCPREDKDILAELAAGWRMGHGARLLASGDTSAVHDGSQRSATMICERSCSFEGLVSETIKGINIWKSLGRNTRGISTEVATDPSAAKVTAQSTTMTAFGGEENSRIASWRTSGHKENASHKSIKSSVRSIQWWSLGKSNRGQFREDASDVVTADNSPLGEPESPRGSSQSSNFEEDDALAPTPIHS